MDQLLHGLFTSQEATLQRHKELDVHINEQRSQVLSMMHSLILLSETINTEQDTAVMALEANGGTSVEVEKLHSDFNLKLFAVAKEQADHISDVLQKQKQARAMKRLSIDSSDIKSSDDLSPRSRVLFFLSFLGPGRVDRVALSPMWAMW